MELVELAGATQRAWTSHSFVIRTLSSERVNVDHIGAPLSGHLGQGSAIGSLCPGSLEPERRARVCLEPGA